MIVLTMIEQDEAVLASLRAGARGYLLKGSGARDETLRAVRSVAAGDLVLGSPIAERLPHPLLTDGASRSRAFQA